MVYTQLINHKTLTYDWHSIDTLKPIIDIRHYVFSNVKTKTESSNLDDNNVCIKTDYFLINICFISSSKGFTTQCCFQSRRMTFEGGLFHINLTTIKVNES